MMLQSLRKPTGRIMYGLVASAVLIALTLLVDTDLLPILPALLVAIWIPILRVDQLRARAVGKTRWAISGLLFGTFALAIAIFLVF